MCNEEIARSCGWEADDVGRKLRRTAGRRKRLIREACIVICVAFVDAGLRSEVKDLEKSWLPSTLKAAVDML